MSVTPLKKEEAMNSDEKNKALDAALQQIERAFGKGSVMKLSADHNPMEVESVSTGSLGLDIGLGIGGVPRGRIVEIYGPESSGKTTSGASHYCRSTKGRWILRHCRCRTCFGSFLCQKAWL